MQEKVGNAFLTEALKEVPRLLAQINRNPSSRSYGSFDRAYWHYRTNDISCARYQEAAYTLGLLYASSFEGNEYHRDAHLLENIRAAIRFTIRLQHNDGSFDEWYPNEGSYVCTAFVSAAFAQLLALFQKEGIKIEEEDHLRAMLERAAEFLAQSQEKTVLNQVSGAVFAIAAIGRLSHRKDLVARADSLLTDFLAAQNPEGWWSEYGGPDSGYLTLTVSYLEKYGRLEGAMDVSGAIEKATSFIKVFVHPDGTAGGEYMSRNTEYLIPSRSLPYLGAVRPAHLDDRYLSYILYNWIETGLQVAPRPLEVTLGEQYFAESGLLKVGTNEYLLVTNGRKGGSFRLYAGGKVYYDSGVEIAAATGKYSTGILDAAALPAYTTGTLRISGAAKRIREPLMTTPVAVVFKAWQFTFGRVPFFKKVVKNLLRLRMVSYSGGSEISFERTIEYSLNSVVVTDRIRGERGSIRVGAKAAYTAVPSSKYAPVPELVSRMLVPDTEETKNDTDYTIRRTFSLS